MIVDYPDNVTMKEPLLSDRAMRRAERVCKNERKQVNSSQCQGACLKVVENKKFEKPERTPVSLRVIPLAPLVQFWYGLNRRLGTSLNVHPFHSRAHK